MEDFREVTGLLLLSLHPSLPLSPLGVLTSSPLLRPRLPVGGAKVAGGETGPVTQQIWQFNPTPTTGVFEQLPW